MCARTRTRANRVYVQTQIYKLPAPSIRRRGNEVEITNNATALTFGPTVLYYSEGGSPPVPGEAGTFKYDDGDRPQLELVADGDQVYSAASPVACGDTALGGYIFCWPNVLALRVSC